MRCALEAFGEAKVLAGSDYPVPLAFGGYPAAMGRLRTLCEGSSFGRRVLADNARALFGGRLAAAEAQRPAQATSGGAGAAPSS